MNVFQYLLGQQGRWSERRISLSLPLKLEELPGDGWSMSGESSWRPGIGSKDEVTSRVWRSGAYTTVRFFEQLAASRSLWIQVLPYVSELDAGTRVSVLQNRVMNNPGRTVTEERNFAEKSIAGVSHSTVFEQFSTGRAGSGLGKYAGGSQGRFVFIVACVAIGEGRLSEIWSWPEVISLAELQASKICKLMCSTE